MTKGDRRVLILLLILVLGLMGYIGISGAGTTQHEEIAPSAIRDTVFIGTNNDSPDRRSADTLPIRTSRYPGPPTHVPYPKKLSEGATIDLNTADTLLLMRVPGIGESFARRIYKYREMLGGYYVVEQLQEVYGMDRERYDQIAPYMRIESPVRPIILTRDSISKHPYLNWQHKKVITQILRSGKELNWQRMMDSGKFTQDDSLRLSAYISF